MKVTFGKGRYFLGDICYALRRDIYDKVWGDKYEFEDGEFEVEGNKFCVAGTAYGDGCYFDEEDIEYGVDAGVIGIVPEKLWKKKCVPSGGRILNVKKSLTFEVPRKGLFKINIDGKKLTIDTR